MSYTDQEVKNCKDERFMKAILRNSQEIVDITTVSINSSGDIQDYFSGYNKIEKSNILKVFDDFDKSFSENWY
jgi:hypothetical protein